MASICILSTGQPSSNPRLVKEADALLEAGHEVRVFCAHWAEWADREDAALLRDRAWTCRYVGGRPRDAKMKYYSTRIRHFLGRRWRVSDRNTARLLALSRVTPDLVAAARRTRADLYIAHNLGALPAAVLGAEQHGGLAGFDAEDFHSGMCPSTPVPIPSKDLTRKVEQEYLPRCRYLTAASPEIGAAYSRRYPVPAPVTVLNVFPLADRPGGYRCRRDHVLRLYWFSQTIGPSRGLEDVVCAMGKLPPERVELHMQGAWQDGYRGRLLEFAARHGVAETQLNSYGPIAPGRLVGNAMRYDVGLSLEVPTTSNRDYCLTNKLFTYVLAGNAIAATSTSAQTHLAARLGKSMALYDSGDADALADILSAWLSDPDALDEARAACWRHGTLEYNWDIERDKLLGAVDQVLSQRSLARGSS